MKILALVLFVVVGCSPAKIRQKALDEYKTSASFPKDCAESFPVKTDTTFLPGKTDTITDYRYYDSTIEVVNIIDTGCIRVVKTVTIRKVDTVVVIKENTAKLEALSRQAKQEAENFTKEIIKQDVIIANQAAEVAKLKAAKRRWFWLFWGAVAIIGAGIYLRIRKVL